MQFEQKGISLICRHKGEYLQLEPWGKNALRVRATMQPELEDTAYAMTEKPCACTATVTIGEEASIRNGRISATVNSQGVLTFYRDNCRILREYYRMYEGTYSKESRCLKVINRTWKGIIGGSEYSLDVRFEANKGEKLFGMGQYQQESFDLKGCELELMQRNSQISVPFALSSLGYGFLWNNPAVGQVTFGQNLTHWVARACRQMDYYITVGDTPGEIVENYTQVTGRPTGFPEKLLGLWQCKLRYRTQEEVLSVARRYHAEGIPLSRIIIDFFHWTYQGDWKFDRTYWPDPKAMVEELHRMGTDVIVSVWPSVDRKSENFAPMTDRGLLIRTERGAAQTYDYQGDCVEIDAFNPEARDYMWQVCRKNYLDYGFDGFWLDNCEPDFGVYDHDHYRYYAGPALAVSNQYPQMFSRIFYDRMKDGQSPVVNLSRCCWAGSQKYGNVIWSGDVPSTFEALRDQIQCGLNMGLAGISWWTTDIGGFMTEDCGSDFFKQLLIRWFQFAAFSPVLRLHGERGPLDIPPLDDRDWGGGYLHTGHANEIWSYGEHCQHIMLDYYRLRLSMKDYLLSLFDQAAATGAPLMRAMFYEFPEDVRCWEIADQYMLGERYLVAPILQENCFERSVYLPKGWWKLTSTGQVFDGQTTLQVAAPIEYMPVFERM